jgi:hypothetical protein
MNFSPQRPHRRSPVAPRQGVVLLVVLTLLSLFVVICTTFVLVAGQYHRAAVTQGKEERYRDPPQKLLDAAMYQLVRGTKDRASAMNLSNMSNPDAQDLLADMYGFDGFIAYALVRGLAPDNSSMTIRIPSPTLNVNAMGQVPPPSLQATFDPRFNDLSYWRSVRDRNLPYFYQNPQPNTTAVQFPAFPGFFGGNLLTFIEAPDPHKPLINVTGRITAYDYEENPSDDTVPYATMTVSWLPESHDTDLPLPAYFTALRNILQSSDPPPVLPIRILVNGRPFNGDGSPNAPDEPFDALGDNLNRFLADVTDPTNPNRMSLHGAAQAAPGLVDNDGDGIPDGFWVDLNLPAQTSDDGRLYRPLVSFLCLDLDGRINLNFHGSRSHLDPHTTQVQFAGTNVFNNTRVFANPFPSEAHGRGSGYGVADINVFDTLAELVNDYAQRRTPPLNLDPATVSAVAQIWYRQLLEGRNFGIQRRGRYGPQNVPGIAGADLLTAQRFLSYLNPRALFDFHSAYALGMDRRGMPLFQPPYIAQPIVDSPYETNILAPRGAFGFTPTPTRKDELFSLDELEDLLRFHDWDVLNRPSRLRFLSEVRYDVNGDGQADTLSFFLDPELRKLVTTESWDLPVPNIQQPRQDGSRMAAFTELLFNRVLQYLPAPQDPQVARGIVRQLVNDGLVAPELLWGQRLDLNRPLETPQQKQRFAAQLYLLMMVVANVNPAETLEVQRVAQWAVNVVDFSDRDAAMTRFEYDRNPLNGWPLQGNTELSVLWGCERPELLISEVVAFHDGRVEMTDQGEPRQAYRPRGSLFVELYNPWATPYYESDLNRFPNMGMGVDGGVQLNEVAPGGYPIWRLEIDIDRQEGGNDLSHQRWVYFRQPPAGLVAAAPNPHMVYFSDLPMGPITPGNYGVVGSVGWVGDPNDPNNQFDIDIDGDNSPNYVTTLGMRDTDFSPGGVDYMQARKFEFHMQPYPFVTGASPVPFLRQVDLRTSFPRPVVGAVVNRFYRDLGNTEWRSLNISEPLDGYLSNETNEVVVIADPAERKYASAPQVAFDPEEVSISAIIRLQRLADPLVPFNAAFNPYITVDTTQTQPLLMSNGDPSVRWFQGTDREADSPNIATRERHGTLWAANDLVWQPGPPGPVVPAGYIFTGTVDNTFGLLNSGFGAPNLAPVLGPSFPQNDPAFYVGAPASPFPWLTWHNRPFMNQYELLQVPATSAEDLVLTYRTPAEIDAGMAAPERPHLLEFVNQTVVPQRRYHHVLEYTHVRSRFLGSEVYSSAGERIPRYREPGRVNINTIPYEAIWESLWNGRELSGAAQPSWIPRFAEVVAERPFRTPPDMVGDWTQHRFLRDFASNTPPFSTGAAFPHSNFPHYNGEIHSYHRYAALNRLGNLITTRSNVFAVWVTVGYFEVDAAPPGVAVQELGLETGEVERHRGFYVIDRSVPVGYEPGENHNVDRAIVLRRFIE